MTKKLCVRPHLNTSFGTNKIVPFPVLKHRRPANKVAKIEECILHCYCRLPDDGYEMVCCDQCDEWYHKACVDNPYCKDGSWLCNTASKMLTTRIVRMVPGYATLHQ